MTAQHQDGVSGNRLGDHSDSGDNEELSVVMPRPGSTSSDWNDIQGSHEPPPIPVNDGCFIANSPSVTSIGRENHYHGGHSEGEAGDGVGNLSSAMSSPTVTASSSSTRARASSESKLFSPISDKSSFASTPMSSSKLSKRESLKVQKKNYRSQKKQAAKELLITLKDPSVIVLADWLKIRGTLKSWTKLWCVLKPGLIILYKSDKLKSSHWIGTVILSACRLIERPSKKDGFCFKLFHPLDQSIWATKGPKGETIGAFVQPLPYSYLIFRAPSESAGKCWMDALELALRCTSLLMRSMTKERELNSGALAETLETPSFQSPTELNESDCEKHFEGQGLDEDCKTDREEIKTESESSGSDEDDEKSFSTNIKPMETQYIENGREELGQQGDECQTEEVNEENKSLIWTLVKQVRPGMDLSKVVLPTFILEPRSFLDKLTDYYYHADMLSEAVLQEDPFTRMKSVVQWYLAGFYKKPKGLKKPYNPIIGETFRCYWRHPKTNSRTFYIAEQISHHPPVSAFHISNRRDGFSISGSILAKSKFYGNSISAILDGTAKLTFLKRGEDYFITMPYAHCKGILIGTLTMEMGGKITINCPKTGYRCDLEFKLKPFLGSGEASNKVSGKIKVGTDTLCSIDGHWDQEIYIKDKMTGESSPFFVVNKEVKAARLKRYTVPLEIQEPFESERLWRRVSEAISNCDMHGATDEKHLLEEKQRYEARERKAKMMEWVPKYFERDLLTGDWLYKYVDLRPWDPINDLLQYEQEFVIQTHTRHKTPVVRTMSITSQEQEKKKVFRNVALARSQRCTGKVRKESGSSTPDPELIHDSDSSETAKYLFGQPSVSTALRQSSLANGKLRLNEDSYKKLVEPMMKMQEEVNGSLKTLQRQVFTLQQANENNNNQPGFGRDWIMLASILLIQIVLQWLMK
ncbi:oxysterol-binding protein-related protein 8 isoform X2 [Patella vulgata]|uniref:oxysterol-binding protein-related protein 8 isoform X2 n=1 Tax=Patella vulgata TaxID=6465 RepID=UPI00217F3C90|nr:oxysterol-binding protein-related protein 8 isoform X2 [Patella vulgata]